MKFYKIGTFAKMIGKSTQTLRRWDELGILKPHHITESGVRYYSEDQYYNFIGNKNQNERITVGYCRVSSSKQKDDLERQINNMKTYLISQGKPFKIITDIGSGINYNNKGLQLLLNEVMENKIEKIVILYKDRLIRFGFDLIKLICDKFNTKIEIIDNEEKTQQQELVEDLIQIITVFSCKLHGKRSNKTKRIIEELVANEVVDKSSTKTNS